MEGSSFCQSKLRWLFMLCRAAQEEVYGSRRTSYAAAGWCRFYLGTSPCFIARYYYIMSQSTHASRVMATGSHYEVLGVGRNASRKDIKKAYREMALMYHPDKNSNPEAKEVFNKLVNSYNVLSNDDQRRIHDDQLARPRQPQQYYPQKQQRTDKNTQKSAPHFRSHYYDHEFSNERQVPRRSQQNNHRQAQSKHKDSNDDFANKYKKTYMPRENNSYKREDNNRPKYRSSYHYKENSNKLIVLGVFLFMILWYFSPLILYSREPLFVLTENELYNVKLKTKTLKATYFVKKDHDPSIQISDEAIQRVYLQKLQKQCDSSLKAKKIYEKIIKRAASQAQQTTFMAALSKIDLKPCKKIIKLIKKHPTLKLMTFANNIVDL